MKTIKTYNLFGYLLLAGAILAGCSKASDSLKPQTAQKQETEKATEAQGLNAFILKIEAENVVTKALTDMGETLGSEWRQGDSLSVYNLTAKENIEGWLYAEADGTSTTFSGTVAGNFNQGDILLLQFLAPDYQEQDGTLEGLAAQCDYATSRVEVTAIDPEAKTIATEHASFEKMQAVVKFDITNRKNPVEPVKVTSFFGYGVLPGMQTPFGIQVTPAAATDELYVGIPYFENMKITFEGMGEDGFEYRLIVPEVSFEDGLYYRRQLNMKRKALVKAPVAKANLSYNGKSQALVDSAHVYWMLNGQEAILDGETDYQDNKCVISYFVKKEVTEGTVPTAPAATENGWMTDIPTQTHAGTYYVWTKMTGNYDYEDADVSSEPVKVVVSKGTANLDASAESGTLTYNGSAQTLLAYAAKLKIGNTDVTGGRDASNTGCTIQYYVSTSSATPIGGSWGSTYTASNAGTYYIWIKVTGNGDIKDISQVMKASKEIKKANITSYSAPTGKTLTFNGNESNINGSPQALISAGSATGGTMQYKLGSGSYGTSVPKATNAGEYTISWKIVGDANHNDLNGTTTITAKIQKANGWCRVTPTSNYFDSHAEVCSITIVCHGGSLTHNSQYYDVNFGSINNGTASGSIQHKSSAGSNWNETITITSAETANYKSASCTFSGS